MEVVAIAGWATYTPEYSGNRLADEPMTVELHPMSRSEWQKQKLAKVDQVSKSLRAAAQLTLDTLRTRCRNPQRFFIRSVDAETGQDTGTREVTDVGELLEYAPDELVSELYDAVMNASKLEEGLAKK